MKENVIQTKNFEFAIRIINVVKYLQNDKKEFILSKQIIRSGTSVGANIEEAIGGQSIKDFIAELSISYKEARETLYWLKLLKATYYLSQDEANSLIENTNEL